MIPLPNAWLHDRVIEDSGARFHVEASFHTGNRLGASAGIGPRVASSEPFMLLGQKRYASGRLNSPPILISWVPRLAVRSSRSWILISCCLIHYGPPKDSPRKFTRGPNARPRYGAPWSSHEGGMRP